MFYECTSLKTINMNNWTVPKLSGASSMFEGCRSLTEINLSSWNTNNLQYVSNMFSGCTALKSVNLSGWDTSNISKFTSMFENCSSLTNLDLSNFNTSNVTGSDTTYSGFYNMFYGCTALKSLDISNFTINAGVNVEEMLYFGENNKIETLKTPKSFGSGVTIPITTHTSTSRLYCVIGGGSLKSANARYACSTISNNEKSMTLYHAFL